MANITAQVKKFLNEKLASFLLNADGAGNGFGSLFDTAQTDLSTAQSQLAAAGAVPVLTVGYMANATVATINGLTPATGDAYVLTNGGTLTAGTVVVTVGDLVEYNGTAWVVLAQAVGGILPACALIFSASANLFGTQVATFDGTSNLPVPTAATNGDQRRVIAGPDGASVNANKIFIFDGTWNNVAPAAAGGGPTNNVQYFAAGAERVANTTVETDFNTVLEIPAGALAAGSVLEGRGHIYIANVNGTPDIAVRLYIAGVAYSAVLITGVTADAQVDFSYQVIVGTAGASGKALINVNGIAYTLAVVGTQKPGSYIATLDTTTAFLVKASVQWSAAHANNQADLRMLTSSYRAASA